MSMTMSETLAYEAGYRHGKEDGKEDAEEEIKELRKNWEFTSDLLNLAIRTGARSMSALIALYEVERKEKDE